MQKREYAMIATIFLFTAACLLVVYGGTLTQQLAIGALLLAGGGQYVAQDISKTASYASIGMSYASFFMLIIAVCIFPGAG